MVTREQVAKKAGVSTGTVSNILNGKGTVAPELVERVKKVMEELSYIPDHNARSLAGKRNKHIGVAVYEYENSYHWEIIRGIEEYAISKGYFVSEFLLDNENTHKLEEICGRKLGALINFMTNEYPDSFIEILKNQKVKLVNFDLSLGPVFTMDYSQAYEEIFAFLAKNGHKKVGYIWSGDEARFNADVRGKMFYDLRKRYRMDLSADLVQYNYEPQLLSYDIGYKGYEKLAERHKDMTAVFATNDLVAIGAIRAMRDCGLRVPEDVCVIGCDDVKIAANYIPSLTTMTFDKRKFGMDIARSIIDNDGDANINYIIKPQAVFRESTEKER